MHTGPGLDLYWIPLGAGRHVVKGQRHDLRGRLRIRSARPRQPLFHSALVATTADGVFVVEMTEIRDGRGRERGVVAAGPVGFAWARACRVFRDEIRRWRNGVIPDLAFSVESPVRITDDSQLTHRILDLGLTCRRSCGDATSCTPATCGTPTR